MFVKVRAVLDQQLFAMFGEEMIIQTLTEVVDNRGEVTSNTVSVSTPVTGVFYDESNSHLRRAFGLLNVNDGNIILPYDTDIQYTDRIVFNGKNFSIGNIRYVPNTENILAIIVRVSKEL